MSNLSDLNSNDYRILESIIDNEKNRGLSRGRGSTIVQIIEKTGFSVVKIRSTIKVLLEMGLILDGVKKVKANAYYLTKEGLQELVDLKKNVSI